MAQVMQNDESAGVVIKMTLFNVHFFAVQEPFLFGSPWPTLLPASQPPGIDLPHDCLWWFNRYMAHGSKCHQSGPLNVATHCYHHDCDCSYTLLTTRLFQFILFTNDFPTWIQMSERIPKSFQILWPTVWGFRSRVLTQNRIASTNNKICYLRIACLSTMPRGLDATGATFSRIRVQISGKIS